MDCVNSCSRGFPTPLGFLVPIDESLITWIELNHEHCFPLRIWCLCLSASVVSIWWVVNFHRWQSNGCSDNDAYMLLLILYLLDDSHLSQHIGLVRFSLGVVFSSAQSDWSASPDHAGPDQADGPVAVWWLGWRQLGEIEWDWSWLLVFKIFQFQRESSCWKLFL